jgi:hypothetical protein
MWADDDGSALHIDVAKPEHFRGHVPTPNTTFTKIQSALRPLIGQQVDAQILATYRIPTAELPPSGLIRLMSVESKWGDFTMRLTGGTLELTGAPLSSLKWYQRKRGEVTIITIDARRSLTLDDQYFHRALDTVDPLLKQFAVGGKG